MTDTVSPARTWSVPLRSLGGLRDLVAKLFPDAEAPVRSRRSMWLGIAVVVVGTVVSLARTTGAGPFQTIWEEDARDLLTDALNNPTAFNLIKPYVGYFQIGPRVLAEFATLFPISWAAAILSIEAAVITALLTLAVYIASGTHLRHPLARFLVSAPMLFSPTAENIVSEIYNRPATLQFFVVYAVFWMILWVPATRAGRIVQLTIVGLSAYSTFLVVLFIPLALLRLWTRRDRISLAMVGFLGSGFVLQVAGLYFGLTDRSFASPRYNPVWALESYVTWAVPHSMLGWNDAWMIGRDGFGLESIVRATFAWLLVIAAIIVAARRITQPSWLLAVVAGAHSIALACFTIMANGMITQRYLLPVEMLLFTALAAVLLPSQRQGNKWLAIAPLALLTAFVLVVSADNYRHTETWRNKGPLWTEQVRLGAQSCSNASERHSVTLRSGPEPYYSLVVVPCHVFRIHRWCEPPYCVQINGAPVPGTLPYREDQR